MILQTIDFGLNVRQAVDAPRLDHEWMPDVATYERDALPPEAIKLLEAMGHVVKTGGGQGDAHSILFDAKTQTAFGANDKRSPDSKASRPQQ